MSNTMEDSEAPLLDTNVDQLAPAEPVHLGDVCTERTRRTSKQPPGGKRRREEEKAKSKAKSKKPSRKARAVSDDDDDDEGGEDEDDEPPQESLETTGKDDQIVDGSQVDVKESEVDEEKIADVLEENTCEQNPKDESDDGKKRRPKAKEKAKLRPKRRGKRRHKQARAMIVEKVFAINQRARNGQSCGTPSQENFSSIGLDFLDLIRQTLCMQGLKGATEVAYH